MLRKQQHPDPAVLKALSPRQPRRARVAMMDSVSDQDHHRQAPSGRISRRFRRAGTREVPGRSEKQRTSIHVRRTVSEEPQYARWGSLIGGTSQRKSSMQEREKSEPPKSTLAQRPHHSGDSAETYSFWSSKPALVMLGSLAMAILFQNINFGIGAFLVFLYQVGVVVTKWKGFLVNHAGVTECLDLTKVWLKYSLRQAERLVKKEDWTRKAALGVFVSNFGITTSVAGGYLKQRQEEVTKRTLAEVERIRDRLHSASS